MKTYHNEDIAYNDADLTNNWSLYASANDRDDDDDDNQEEEPGDWGDVDPAGGDEPTSPGSAV